jgi:RND family efflux transporter MFP subunit
LLIVLIVLGYWYTRQTSAAVTKNGTKLTQKYTVKRTDVENILSLSGTVEAGEKIALQFQTSGRLAWVGVKEGDRVKKWQSIASLDTRELRKNLDKKLNDFLDSRWDYDQTKANYQSAATGDWNIYLSDSITRIAQQSQFGLNKTIIDVELANLAIELSTIISPIDGVITHIDQPIPGVNITPAGARFEVVNPETLYLHGLVDQQDVVKLSVGKKVEMIFDPFPDKTYTGEIYYISYTPEAGEDNSYAIKISIPAAMQEKLRIGMGAEASIISEKKTNVLAIPPSAISEEGDKKYVYVLKDKTTEKQYVKTGLETDELTHIKSGIKEGDVIVY